MIKILGLILNPYINEEVRKEVILIRTWIMGVVNGIPSAACNAISTVMLLPLLGRIP